MRAMIPSRPLNNNIAIPTIGFGTWQIAAGGSAESAVRTALEAGYRLIDTAKIYGNEESVGRAVRDSGIPREEIFVTTKLWPTDFLNPTTALSESLDRLGLHYVDLYLIHWPVPMMPKSIWRALEDLYASARIRALGVSNYGVRHLESLLSYAKIPPAVNQIEYNPLEHRTDVVEYCATHSIAVEAYSPLMRGHNMTHPSITAVAEAHGKTPAQILIRWCLEHETIPLPKSGNPDRIKDNINVFDFELSQKEIQSLDDISA